MNWKPSKDDLEADHQKDEIKRIAGTNWRQVAMARSEWKRIREEEKTIGVAQGYNLDMTSLLSADINAIPGFLSFIPIFRNFDKTWTILCAVLSNRFLMPRPFK